MKIEITAILVALGCAVLVGLGEYWHTRRSAKVRKLAYGPEDHPKSWTRCCPFLRVIAMSVVCWGLVILAFSDPEAMGTESEAQEVEEQGEDPEDLQRVMLVLDISPSMNAVDAGPNQDKRRRDRVMDVVEGVLHRIALTRTRFSVVVFFTSARPVVVDARDTNVVRNILDNLPLIWSFEPGETQLLSGLEKAAELAANWPPESTTLFLCTDGDTVDFSKVPKMPSSIRGLEILAVGDPLQSTRVGRHETRQQAAVLKRLAAEMGGQYHDVNRKHMPSSALTDLSRVPPPPPEAGMSLKELARLAVLIGATILGALPLLLQYFGTNWKPHREFPAAASAGSGGRS